MSKVLSQSLFTEYDIHLFKEGKHYRLFEKLGAHLTSFDDQTGVMFAVWAPNAIEVSVIGDFNHWNSSEHPLNSRWDNTGIWEGFVPNLPKGTHYKFSIKTRDGRRVEKGDPFAKYWEIPPRTASIVWDNEYKWKDKKWMKSRASKNAHSSPFSVYEVHLGSWKKKPNNDSLSYQEMAEELVAYVKELGFTHIEMMPVMEHPYYPSWGYQITGYFAPTSRYGDPQEFMYLVDKFHEAGIGVILDWVPSHFPSDEHGLADFDGTHLYEHDDPRKGFHPDWKSYIFNYGRFEVRSFLISNAIYWLEKFHIDGLRVDAVASMLYLDYSRKEGEWIPNHLGGRENLEAISFLKEFNEAVYAAFPDCVTIAEESTSWSGVSRPTYSDGLGFGQKWMMGWMHDTLKYMGEDPINRKYHHGKITFSLIYAFTENFQLPLSHDEVVHGKGSLISRMPGDDWQKFANLRLLYGYMFTHPGTKLLFMGAEIGQWEEWSISEGIHWGLLDNNFNKGIQKEIADLNNLYKKYPALYRKQFEDGGFEWCEINDYQNSVLSYFRKGNEEDEPILVLCNFTPEVRKGYRVGVHRKGEWKEIFNSDDKKYSGSGVSNGKVKTDDIHWHGKNHSLSLTLPPLSVIVLK